MAPMTEYLRPWKLATLAIGIGLLIFGAYYEQSPDWDVGISILMAVLTYLTAPWSMRVLLERRYRWFPLAAFWTWLSVDGVYWAWNSGLPDISGWRDANFLASLSLYGICGMIWIYNGSLHEMASEIRGAINRDRRRSE
jgi:hypothetical protein